MRCLIHCVFIVVVSFLLPACVSVPKGIQPISPFDVQRYLGAWYEIARLENSFEAGLTRVTADYSLLPDGTVQVKNVGFSPESGKWKEAIGKADFVNGENKAHLKVSFQWPFYSSYIVFKLDPNYRYAYVTGNDRDYLWLLSRTPSVSEEVLEDFKKTAQAQGFNLDDLVIVDHTPLD